MTSSAAQSFSFAAFARRYRGEISLILATIAVVVVATLVDQSHAYWRLPGQNAREILRLTAMLGIVALGATIVIVSGGIDLSAGSVMAFGGAICASIIVALVEKNARGLPVTSDVPLWIISLALAGTLLVGFLIGTFHAWLITVVGLPPFVATLASLVGLRSLGRVIVQDVNAAVSATGSSTDIQIADARFRAMGEVWWIPLVIFLVLSAVCWVLMSRTVVGRHLYAMGGNESAARLSGIRTDRLKWLAYCLSAMTASMAGVLVTGFVSKASPATASAGFELNAIAAAVVGGCSLQGGIGTIFGTMLGALFLQTVINSVGKIIKTTPDDFQGLIVGILVVLAVAFNELRGSSGLQKRFFPGALGVLSGVILSGLAGVISAAIARTGKLPVGLVVGTAVAVLVGVRWLLERRASSARIVSSV